MSTLTAIMPCHNEEERVKKAMESILEQSYADFEFIAIDDGSSDNTAKIIEEYADKDERIIFLQNEEEKGASYSINRGIAVASGKYIARLRAADLSLAKRFEKQIDFLEEHEDIGVLGSFVQVSDAEKEEILTFPEENEAIGLSFLFGDFSAYKTAMIRKSVLNEHKLRYDEEYDGAEDYEFFYRLKDFAKFHILPEALVTSPKEPPSAENFKILNKALKEIIAEDFYIPLYENPNDTEDTALRESFRVISEIPLMLLKEDCPFTRSELNDATMEQREYILEMKDL